MEEIRMVGYRTGGTSQSLAVFLACVCFALAALTAAGIVSVGKVSWTDLGLFFGFLSFLF
jgi:hypothetical protein